jgi:hypothetical protein
MTANSPCPFAIETKNWNHCRGIAVIGEKITRYCDLHPEYTCIIKEGLKSNKEIPDA